MDIYFTIAFFMSTILGVVWFVTIVQLFKLSGIKDVQQISGCVSQGSNFGSAFFNIFGVRSSLSTFEPIKAQVRKMRWVLAAFLVSFGGATIGVISMFAA
jgi:hypothetical protein